MKLYLAALALGYVSAFPFDANPPAASTAGSTSGNSTAAGGGGASGPGMTTDLSLPADKKTGQATFYTFWNSDKVSCNPAKCPDDGFCAAIPLSYMQPSGSSKASCGKCIKVVYEGKAAIVRVMDTCPECPDVNIDLSDKLFEQLVGDKGKGRVQLDWGFVDCNSGAAASGGATPTTPTASSATPASSSATPAASGAAPSTSSAASSTSNANPATSNANPATSSAIPATSSAAPLTSNATRSVSGAGSTDTQTFKLRGHGGVNINITMDYCKKR